MVLLLSLHALCTLVQAALCNPPLEEGDQVLYICGKSVAEKTHEQVIGMIRSSREVDPRWTWLKSPFTHTHTHTHNKCALAHWMYSLPHTFSELILIVKPRDLSRINPTINKRSLPQISDPGHMLRESLTCLKEMFLSERALLHFDVSQLVLSYSHNSSCAGSRMSGIRTCVTLICESL